MKKLALSLLTMAALTGSGACLAQDYLEPLLKLYTGKPQMGDMNRVCDKLLSHWSLTEARKYKQEDGKSAKMGILQIATMGFAHQANGANYDDSLKQDAEAVRVSLAMQKLPEAARAPVVTHCYNDADKFAYPSLGEEGQKRVIEKARNALSKFITYEDDEIR